MWLYVALAICLIVLVVLVPYLLGSRSGGALPEKKKRERPTEIPEKGSVWESLTTDVEKALYILSTPQEVEYEAPKEMGDKVKNYTRRMKRWVVGQDEALESVAQILYRRTTFARGHGPLATLLFLGPRGVGKTVSAKAIGDALFGSPRASFLLDLADPFSHQYL